MHWQTFASKVIVKCGIVESFYYIFVFCCVLSSVVQLNPSITYFYFDVHWQSEAELNLTTRNQLAPFQLVCPRQGHRDNNLQHMLT